MQQLGISEFTTTECLADSFGRYAGYIFSKPENKLDAVAMLISMCNTHARKRVK